MCFVYIYRVFFMDKKYFQPLYFFVKIVIVGNIIYKKDVVIYIWHKDIL